MAGNWIFSSEVLMEEALPYLGTRQNDLHTRICLAYAMRLLKKEGGRAEVVVPAIILHDVGWSSVPEEEQLKAFGPDAKNPELTRVHEREGARIASAILGKLGCPPELAGEIVEIVAGHDTRKNPLSPEDALVKDSDKLFRYSAEGYRIDAARFNKEPVGYLEWLSARIDEWFLTETGRLTAKAEAEARLAEVHGAGKRTGGSGRKGTHMGIYGKIYDFAAGAGALEGYVYPREKVEVSYLEAWIGRLERQYGELPPEAKEEFQGLCDGTLGRAMRSLEAVLGKDHDLMKRLGAMVKGNMPASPDDFTKDHG